MAATGVFHSHIFWTLTDSDQTQFDNSDVRGDSTAVAISNAYAQDNRSATNFGDAAVEIIERPDVTVESSHCHKVFTIALQPLGL